MIMAFSCLPATGRIHFTPFCVQHFAYVYLEATACFTGIINIVNLITGGWVFFVGILIHTITP
jgi:hypothetical protein